MFFGLLGIHNFYNRENNAGFLHIGITVLAILIIVYGNDQVIGLAFFFIIYINAVWVFKEVVTIK